jgi:hypothetical protein
VTTITWQKYLDSKKRDGFTDYMVTNIPNDLWKACRKKSIDMDTTMGKIILKFLVDFARTK